MRSWWHKNVLVFKVLGYLTLLYLVVGYMTMILFGAFAVDTMYPFFLIITTAYQVVFIIGLAALAGIFPRTLFLTIVQILLFGWNSP